MTKLSESTKAWAQGLLKAGEILTNREAVEGPAYYTDLSLKSASHSHDDEQGHYIFNDGNNDYWINWLRYPNHGWRFQKEHGKRNGVTVDIQNVIADDGKVLEGDTLYNGIGKEDIRYDYLQRKFEGSPQINLNYLNYSK